MNLLGRLKGATPEPQRAAPLTMEQWAAQLNSFAYNNWHYPTNGVRIQETLAGQGTERPANTFEGLAAQAYQANGIVFACMLVRQLVFSSVRFRWQRIRNGSPSDSFGNKDLRILEEPWTGGTTQDMLSRLIQDADLAGNSYWYRETSLARLGTRDGGELVRLRPDWVQIVGEKRFANVGPSSGAQMLNNRTGQVGWRKLGYIYTEGGVMSNNEPVPFLASEVAHFAPVPDPLATFAGMSWLTPVLREIQADQAMTKHQRKFFDNGATPNMVIRHFAGAPGVAGASRDAVKKWVEEFETEHRGADNAYKTLQLYPGADITVVGANLKDIDFSNVRGGGEVRVAAAAGVPPVIAGLSKGIESSTYSNYTQARRRFADGTIHPLWQNASGSLQRVLPPPDDASRLWYDASDVPFLREDEKDAAAIAAIKAETINSYITAGFEPQSVVAAVEANDLNLLVHTGWYSVQLQKPGENSDAPEPDSDTDGRNRRRNTLENVGRVLELLGAPNTKEDQ